MSDDLNRAGNGVARGPAAARPPAPQPGALPDEIVVFKFGGTSLASPRRLRRAAARIRAQAEHGRAVVAVVSAAGHETDRLLTWTQALAKGGRPGAGGELVAADPAAPAASADQAGEAARREVDRILATGEDRSAGLLALALGALGLPARSLRGGEAGLGGKGTFGAGAIELVTTTRLRRLLAEGIVPVIAGFQAERADGETVTLGRGGSDISAVAVAAALGAAACHIVTDVAAVYDRDPRTDPGARPFTTLTHAELVALTESGAEVVHPRAARLAAEHRLPLLVYGYRAPWSGGGTLVGGTLSGTDVPLEAA